MHPRLYANVSRQRSYLLMHTIDATNRTLTDPLLKRTRVKSPKHGWLLTLIIAVGAIALIVLNEALKNA